MEASQQELIWIEHQVLNVEAALEEAGAIARRAGGQAGLTLSRRPA